METVWKRRGARMETAPAAKVALAIWMAIARVASAIRYRRVHVADVVFRVGVLPGGHRGSRCWSLNFSTVPGDRDAAFYLARLLAERGDRKELRARADAGRRVCCPAAAAPDGSAQLRRFGLNPDGSIACADTT